MAVETPQLASLSYRLPHVGPGEQVAQDTIDRLTHALAPRELDARFLDALERGEVQGDLLMVDGQGNEVRNALPRPTIFDL